MDIIPQHHHIIQALCAVSIGYNTNPGGIDRVGPSSVFNCITSLYQKHGNKDMKLIYDDLQIWIKRNIDNQSHLDLLNIYADSFIFEPVVTDDIQPVDE